MQLLQNFPESCLTYKRFLFDLSKCNIFFDVCSFLQKVVLINFILPDPQQTLLTCNKKKGSWRTFYINKQQKKKGAGPPTKVCKQQKKETWPDPLRPGPLSKQTEKKGPGPLGPAH